MLNKIVSAFRDSDFSRIKEYVLAYPGLDSIDFALEALDLNDPFYAVAAIESVASNSYFGRSLERAIIFAYACFHCVDIYLESSDTGREGEILYYGGSSLYYILKSHLDMGDIQAGIDFYHRAVSRFEVDVSKPEFNSARLSAVELYLAAYRYEEAKRVLSEIGEEALSYSDKPYYDRLSEKLRRLFVAVETMPDDAVSEKKRKLEADLQQIIDSWDTALATKHGKPDEEETAFIQELQGLIRRLKSCDDDGELEELLDVIRKKNRDHFSSLFKNGAADSLDEKRNRVGDLAKLIFEEEDLNLTERYLAELEEYLLFFENKYPEDENYILWLLGNGYGFIEQFERAVNALERLYVNLETSFGQMSNPRERGGVFNQYPLLFSLLIRNYFILKNPKGVLKAVEASKGRVLAAPVFERENQDVFKYENLNLRLEAVLKREKVHYLSFFVDEDYTISALVTSSGKYYVKGTDGINGKVLDKWIAKGYQSPLNWNNGATGIFGRKSRVDIGAELEVLLDVVKLAMEEGAVSGDDHIVYSQDEELMLFPLHYARFNDGFLIDSFSLSRVHAATQLISLVSDDVAPIGKVLCFSVPSKQDAGNVGKLAAFGTVCNWMRDNGPVAVVAREPVVASVSSSDMRRSVVHFVAHGVFPLGVAGEPEKNNPYYNSGILLRNGDELPVLDVDFNYFTMENLLSPQKLMGMGSVFEKSHITFQSCVSGRSREAVGGDAIGMEWAAFYCGADSLLTSAWDVDILWTNRFSILFYENWLNRKMNRGEAYTKAMREIKKNPSDNENMAIYQWGGMVLSGNWK